MTTLLAAAAFALLATTAHADLSSESKEHILSKNAALVEIYHDHCEALPLDFRRKTAQALETIQARWIIEYERSV